MATASIVTQRIRRMNRCSTRKLNMAVYLISLSLIFLYFILVKTYPDLPLGYIFILIVGVATAFVAVLWTIEYDASVFIGLFQIGWLFISFSSLFTVIQFRLYGQDSYNTASIAAELIDSNALDTYPLPLYHLLSHIIGTVFLLNLESAMKYLSLLLFAGLSLLALQLFRTHFDVRSSLMATLGLTTLPWFVEFNSWAVKQSLGMPLMLLGVYFLIRHDRTNNPRYVILYATTLVTALFTHHLSTALIMLALISLVWTRTILSGEAHGRFGLRDYLLDESFSERVSVTMFRPLFLLTALSAVITIFYWLFHLETPIDALLIPILTGVSGRISLSSFVGSAVPISYTSVQSHFRLEWLQLKVAFVAGSMVGITVIRIVYDSLVKDISDVVWGSLILYLVGAYVISGWANLRLGFLRIIMISWPFVLPLFLGLLGAFDRRARRIIFTGFVVLNLIAFPIHVIHPTVSPDYDSSNLGYGFQETDHKGGQWLQSFGERSGQSESSRPTTVAVDIKHFALLNWYWDSTNEYRSWVLFTNSEPVVAQHYIYVTPSARHFLKTGHNSSTMTTNPPNLSTLPDYDQIYDSSEITILMTG